MTGLIARTKVDSPLRHMVCMGMVFVIIPVADQTRYHATAVFVQNQQVAVDTGDDVATTVTDELTPTFEPVSSGLAASTLVTHPTSSWVALDLVMVQGKGAAFVIHEIAPKQGPPSLGAIV